MLPIKNNNQESRSPKGSLPLKLAAVGLSALVLIPILAVLALHVPGIQQGIISRMATLIEANTNCSVEADSFGWWPLSEINLSRPRIQAEGNPVLTCENARVSYSFLTNSPFVRVDLVWLEKPVLQLERTPEGKWRIPVKFAKRPGKPGGHGRDGEPFWTRLELPKLQIVGGTIEGRQQGKTILTVKDVTGTLQLKAVHGVDGREISVDFKDWQARSDTTGMDRGK